MGLFDKERFGTVERLDDQRRRFAWILPNFAQFTQGTYDSAKDKTMLGVSFHFHLVIGERWDVGFYVHHKGSPIPKYSFYFSSGPPPRAKSSTSAASSGVLQPPNAISMHRQHVAHSIPPETERVGHWNVCSFSDCCELLKVGPGRASGPLWIVFQFDDDEVVLEDATVGSNYFLTTGGTALMAALVERIHRARTQQEPLAVHTDTPASRAEADTGTTTAASPVPLVVNPYPLLWHLSAALLSGTSRPAFSASPPAPSSPSSEIYGGYPGGGTRAVWRIPNVSTSRFAPFTSRSFQIEGQPLVLRIDRLLDNDAAIVSASAHLSSAGSAASPHAKSPSPVAAGGAASPIASSSSASNSLTTTRSSSAYDILSASSTMPSAAPHEGESTSLAGSLVSSDGMDFNIFLFARGSLVPRHQFALYTDRWEPIAADEDSAADEGAVHVLRVPQATVFDLRRQHRALLLVVYFPPGSNPLDFFARQAKHVKAGGAIAGPPPPTMPATTSIGTERGAQYHLMSDDL
mgnify:FL=1